MLAYTKPRTVKGSFSDPLLYKRSNTIKMRNCEWFWKKNEKILSDLYILVSEIGENLFDYFTVEGFLYHWGLCTFTTVK